MSLMMDDDQAPEDYPFESMEQVLNSLDTADPASTKGFLLKMNSVISFISRTNKKLLEENRLLKSQIKGFEEFWSSILLNNFEKSDEEDVYDDLDTSDNTQEETPLHQMFRTFKEIPQMIEDLERSQIKSEKKFDKAMEGLRQHLSSKDLERKKSLKELKNDIEKEIILKTGVLKESISNLEIIEETLSNDASIKDIIFCSDKNKNDQDNKFVEKFENSKNNLVLVWAKAISIVITSPQQSVLLSQLPTLFQRQFGECISCDLNFISDFVKENPLESRITGKGEHAVLWYFNNVSISSDILVYLLSSLLNDCDSFNATATELSKLLEEEYEIFVDANRVMNEALKHEDLFDVSSSSSKEKLVKLGIDPKKKFLFAEMAFLIQKNKRKLNNFGNVLRDHLGWNFSLKSYGHSSFQDLFDSFGPQFFSILGQGNEKFIKLGDMGETYCNLILLLQKENGTICLNSLDACYRKEYNKQLTFSSKGCNSISDFVSKFYTDFKIMGETDSEFLVLYDAIFE